MRLAFTLRMGMRSAESSSAGLSPALLTRSQTSTRHFVETLRLRQEQIATRISVALKFHKRGTYRVTSKSLNYRYLFALS